MSLANDLGIGDLNELDMGEAEKQVAMGNLAPEGVHHAVLDTFRQGETPTTGSKFRELGFIITAGPAKGLKAGVTLWVPEPVQESDSDEEKKKKKNSANRIAIFYHRLGLLKKVKGADGKERPVPVEGKHDLGDCLGATCFIEVKHEEESWDDKKTGQRRSMKKAKLTWEGVLSPTDKRCQGIPTATAAAAEAVRAAGGAAVAAGGVGAGAGGAGGKKDDYSDL